MLEIWCHIHLKLISHLQDDKGSCAKPRPRTRIVPGLGLAQDLVHPAHGFVPSYYPTIKPYQRNNF